MIFSLIVLFLSTFTQKKRGKNPNYVEYGANIHEENYTENGNGFV